jgi:hypothetical protein
MSNFEGKRFRDCFQFYITLNVHVLSNDCLGLKWARVEERNLQNCNPKSEQSLENYGSMFMDINSTCSLSRKIVFK